MKRNIKIPTTVVDTFFDTPDKVRQWAIQLPFHPATDGRWPGLRTEHLFNHDSGFFDSVIKKSLSLFFNLEQETKMSWEADMFFQIVHKNYDSGWVHSDVSDSQITGIVYLNKDTNLAGGTSIMREKNNILVRKDSFNTFKQESYLKKKTIQEVEKYREEHNNQFEETINISNVYNRLVLFDSHLYHKAQSFFGEDDDARLTLIFFITKLWLNDTPISRLQKVL